jgi:hypothetical protein
MTFALARIQEERHTAQDETVAVALSDAADSYEDHERSFGPCPGRRRNGAM